MRIITSTVVLFVLFTYSSTVEAQQQIIAADEVMIAERLKRLEESSRYQQLSQSDNPADREKAARMRENIITLGESHRKDVDDSMNDIPSREDIKSRLQKYSLIMADRYPGGVPIKSEMLEHLVALGCIREVYFVDGIERQPGGLNGITQLFACDGAYITVTEMDFSVPTIQTVKVYDNEYANDPESNLYRVRTTRVMKNDGHVWHFSWIHPYYDIRVDLYGYGNGLYYVPKIRDAIIDVAIERVGSYKE